MIVEDTGAWLLLRNLHHGSRDMCWSEGLQAGWSLGLACASVPSSLTQGARKLQNDCFVL